MPLSHKATALHHLSDNPGEDNTQIFMIVQVNNRISQDFDSFQMKKHHGLPKQLSVEANDEMMKCFRATTAFENDQKKIQLTKKNIALFQ